MTPGFKLPIQGFLEDQFEDDAKSDGKQLESSGLRQTAPATTSKKRGYGFSIKSGVKSLYNTAMRRTTVQ